MLAVFNAQVLVDKPVQMVAVRLVEVLVMVCVKTSVMGSVKMIALQGVKDNVPMAALAGAKVVVQALVVETVGMDAVVAAMVQLVYSNGE